MDYYYDYYSIICGVLQKNCSGHAVTGSSLLACTFRPNMYVSSQVSCQVCPTRRQEVNRVCKEFADNLAAPIIAQWSSQVEELKLKLKTVSCDADALRAQGDRNAARIKELENLLQETSDSRDRCQQELADQAKVNSELKSSMEKRQESDNNEAALRQAYENIPHFSSLELAKPCGEEVRLPLLLSAAGNFVVSVEKVKDGAHSLEKALQDLRRLQDRLKSEADEGARKTLVEEREATAKKAHELRNQCSEWQAIIVSSSATCQQQFDGKLQGLPPAPSGVTLTVLSDDVKQCLARQEAHRHAVLAEEKTRCHAVDAALSTLGNIFKPSASKKRKDFSVLPRLLGDLYVSIEGYIAPLPHDHVPALRAAEAALCSFIGSTLVDASNLNDSLEHLSCLGEEAVDVLQRADQFSRTFRDVLDASQKSKENVLKRNRMKESIKIYKANLEDGLVEPSETDRHLEQIKRFEKEYLALAGQASAMNEALRFLRQHQHSFPEYHLQQLSECQSATLADLISHEGVVYRSLNDYVRPALVMGKCFPATLNGTPCFLRCCSLDSKDTEHIVRRELRVKERVRSPHVMSPDEIFVDMSFNSVVFHYKHMAGTLEDLVSSTTCPMAVDNLLDVAEQLVAGLLAMHDFKVVHGDISPRNILVNDHLHAFLADFAESTCDETRSMTRVTLGFLPPEALRDLAKFKATAESDAFALGATLKEALTKTPSAIPTSRLEALGSVLERTLLPTNPANRSLKACQEELSRLKKLWRAEDEAQQKELARLLSEIQDKEQALQAKLAASEVNAADVELMQSVVEKQQKEVEAKQIELQSLKQKVDALNATLSRSQQNAEREALRLQEEVKAATAAATDAAARTAFAEVPSYWSAKSGPTLQPRTRFVEDKLRGVFPNMRQVERVENHVLWLAFRAECKKLLGLMQGRPFTSIPQPALIPQELSGLITADDALGVGEVYLFHGTDQKSLPSIVQMGFDPSWSSQGLLGHGSYFTPHAQKALQYAGKSSGSKVIVIARVAIGVAEIVPAGQARQGLRKPSDGHHSVFGTPNSTTPGMLEVVVYTINRAYPEFVVYLS